MIKIRLAVMAVVIFVLISVGISVEGTEEINGAEASSLVLSKTQIEAIIRGAVEDQTWMYSRSRGEVDAVLSKYFTGNLLNDLTLRCWEFIDEPTDSYSIARLEDLQVVYNDEKRAVAEAVISIEDVDTGHNEVGKGLFTLLKTPDGWRISYACYSWNNKTG